MNKSELKDVLKASYMPQKQAAAYLEKRQGYSYDPQLSSMQQKVFLDREGKPIIVQRGSTRLSDWLIEDPAGYLGYTNTTRVKEAKELAKATKDKYGVDATLTGHSLAGYLQEQAAKATPQSEVYTYNKLAGFPSVFSSIPKTQHDYRTPLDIPSFLGQYQGGDKNTVSGSWNPIASHDINYL
jgi:hypothetical protein